MEGESEIKSDCNKNRSKSREKRQISFVGERTEERKSEVKRGTVGVKRRRRPENEETMMRNRRRETKVTATKKGHPLGRTQRSPQNWL